MAIDVNSNKYTFAFAAVMVVVVASLLAFASESLKEKQGDNVRIEKKQNILGSVGYSPTAEEANAMYDAKLKMAVVLDGNGTVVSEDKEAAFNVDVMKDYKGGLAKLYARHKKGLADWDWEAMRSELVSTGARYPLYVIENAGGELAYVVPMTGTGLWGPVWGYVAVGADGSTILGASFDHKSETPGLGAEISQASFQRPFIGKQLIGEGGNFMGISVVKGGAGEGNSHGVDAISGGTITSNGVTEMLQRTLRIYEPYLKSLGATSAPSDALPTDSLGLPVDSLGLVTDSLTAI